jgi:hypothetical protein
MKKTMFLFLLLWFSASVLAAQGLAASAGQSGDAVVPVTLGQSVVALICRLISMVSPCQWKERCRWE